jgi:glycosyltransferase involved in cell wall biosynthesis
MNSISIIMPVYGTKHKLNAEAVIRSWEQANVDSFTELLVMEPDCSPCLDYYGKATRIQTPNDPNIWLLSTLRNDGVEYSKYDLVCFHDCDAIITKEWCELNAKCDYDCFPSYRSVSYLKGESSNKIRKALELKCDYQQHISISSSRGVIGRGCGLSFCMTKKMFKKIGPWMVLKGWGGEDEEYAKRIYGKLNGLNLRNITVNCNLYHLDHEKSDRNYVSENKSIIRL